MINRVSYVRECVKCIISMAQQHINKPYCVLELFAGKGSLYTNYLSQNCINTIGWEINPIFKTEFEMNVKNGVFLCRDTINTLKFEELDNLVDKSNIISIDNPLGIYGNNYCEHFDFFTHIYKVVLRPSIIAFNVVKKPYNFLQNSEWVEKRKQFYRITEEELNLEYALEFYKKLLTDQDLIVNDMKIICRELDEDLDYFYMIVCAVEKKEEKGV